MRRGADDGRAAERPQAPRRGNLAGLQRGAPQSMLEMQMEDFFGKANYEDVWPTDPVAKAKIFNNTTRKDFKLKHNLVAAPLIPMGGDIDIIVDVLRYFLRLAKTSNVVIMKAMKRFFRAVHIMNKFIHIRKIKRMEQVEEVLRWWHSQELKMREELRSRASQPNFKIHSQGAEASQVDDYNRTHVPDEVKAEVVSVVYLRQRLVAAKERRDWRERLMAAQKVLAKVKADFAAYRELSDAQKETLRRARVEFVRIALQCPRSPKRLLDRVSIDQLLSVREEVMLRRSKVARREFLAQWEAERAEEQRAKREQLKAAMKRKRDELARKKALQEQQQSSQLTSAMSLASFSKVFSNSTGGDPLGASEVESILGDAPGSPKGLSITGSLRSYGSVATTSPGSRFAHMRFKGSAAAVNSMLLQRQGTQPLDPAVAALVERVSRGKRKLFGAVALASDSAAMMSAQGSGALQRTQSGLSSQATVTNSPTASGRGSRHATPGRQHLTDTELARHYSDVDAARRAERVEAEERRIVASVLERRRTREPPPLPSFIAERKRAAQESGLLSGGAPYEPKESCVRIRATGGGGGHDERSRRSRSAVLVKYDPLERTAITEALNRSHVPPAVAIATTASAAVVPTHVRPSSAVPSSSSAPRENGGSGTAVVSMSEYISRNRSRPQSAIPGSAGGHRGSPLRGQNGPAFEPRVHHGPHPPPDIGSGGPTVHGVHSTIDQQQLSPKRTETGALLTVPAIAAAPSTRPASASLTMSISSIAKVRDESAVRLSPRVVLARPATSGGQRQGAASPSFVVEQTDGPLLYDYSVAREIQQRHAATFATEQQLKLQPSFFSHKVKRTAMAALDVVIRSAQ